VERIRQSGHPDVRHVGSFTDAVEAVLSAAKEGDLILTLGAGNVHQLGPMLLNSLAVAQPSSSR